MRLSIQITEWVCYFLAIALLFTGLLVLSQVVDQTKNEGGIIASSSREQLFTALKDAISDFEVPKGVLKDIAISPDNQRLHTITGSLTETRLSAYSLSSTDTDPVAELTPDGSVLYPQDGGARSLAISRDASLAFIAFKDKLMATNIKPITVYDAATDSSVVEDVYGWKMSFVFDHKNFTQIEVGPSGNYLYYVADFSELVSEPYSDSTDFGEFGAYRIERPMGAQLFTSTDTDTGDLVASLSVSTDTDIKFAWSKDIVRPEAELGDLERGGSDAFLGPFSFAISPDEDYAIITAQGPNGIGIFDPVLGRIPPRDETEGGMLIIDLQKRPGGSDTEVGDYLGYLPTLVEGEKRLGARLARYARNVKHPTVTFFDVLKDAAFGNAVSLSGTGSGFASGSAIQDTLRKLTIFGEYDKVFQNYGILKAYQNLYTNDMVGASDIGIDPKGDMGLVTMKWTNNLGILELEPAMSLHGYSSDTPISEKFSIKAALEKDMQVNEVTSSIKELFPESVEFTANGSLAYVGMRGGNPSNAFFGGVDLLTLKQVMASKGEASFSEGGLPKNLMSLRSADGETLKNPKLTSTYLSDNIDGDRLSDHVEAYNRLNWQDSEFIDSWVVTSAYTEKTTTLDYNNDASQGIHLPITGTGYRHRELRGKNRSNAGKPALIKVLERVGRRWHHDYLSGTTTHSYFVITDLSPPGWGIQTDESGNVVHLDRRAGDIANIQYFRTDGTDNPYDFVLSNDSDPLNNSVLADLDEFDEVATCRLIKFLAECPEVTQIIIDPGAFNAMNASSNASILDTSKVVIRSLRVDLEDDGLDNNGDGEIDEIEEHGIRRDMDSWLQIQTVDVHVDLIAVVDDNPIPNWDEQRPYGAGVLKTNDTTTGLIFNSEGISDDPEQFFHVLKFDSNLIDISGVTSEVTEVISQTEYKIDSLSLPVHLRYADIVLQSFYHFKGNDILFSEDIVSLIPGQVDIKAVSEQDEQLPNGSGISGTGSTFELGIESQFDLQLRLYFDGLKIEASTGEEIMSGSLVFSGEYTIVSWYDPRGFVRDITVRGFNDENQYVSEDVLTVSRVDLDIIKPDKTTVVTDSIEYKEGLYLIKNDDDDNADGSVDHGDSAINGASDKDDMGKVILRKLDSGLSTGVTATLSMVSLPFNPGGIRLFNSSGNVLSLPRNVTSDMLSGDVSYLVEGVNAGEVILSLVLSNGSGTEFVRDEVKVFTVPLDFFVSPDAVEIENESTGETFHEISADFNQVDINVFGFVYDKVPDGNVYEFFDSGDLYAREGPPHLPFPNPLPENASISWQIVSGSGGSLSETSTVTDVFGDTKTTLTLDTEAGSDYQIEGKLVSLEYDGCTITRNQKFKTAKIMTIPGSCADITVIREVDGGSASSYPADGHSEMILTATFRDQYGNRVGEETPVEWELQGPGEIVEEDFLTDANGEAKATIRSGIIEADQNVLIIGDFFGKTETISNDSVNITGMSSSIGSLDINLGESAAITVNANVPDGTPVLWYTTNGSLSINSSTVSGGSSTTTLFSGNGLTGEALVTAAIGNTVEGLAVPFASSASISVSAARKVLAGDTNFPGIVAIPQLDGNSIDFSYDTSTDVTISAPLFAGFTANISGTGESDPNILSRFPMDTITTDGTIVDSVGGIIGTVSGAILDSAIKREGAASLSFNGVDDVVTLADTPSLRLHEGVRMTVWVNSETGSGTLISKPGEYQLELSSDGRPTFTVTTDAGDFSVNFQEILPLNDWQQITGEYKDGLVRIIVGEKSNVRHAPGQPDLSSPEAITIGSGFNGHIDKIVFADGPALHHDLEAARYYFDSVGSKGEVFDSAGGRDGINHGATLDTDVKYEGTASLFFEEPDNLTIEDAEPLRLREGIIFRVWVNPQQGGGMLISKEGEYNLELTEDLEPRFTIVSTEVDNEGNPIHYSVTDPMRLQTNVWTRVEASFTSCEIRINDVRNALFTSPAADVNPVQIGGGFSGNLDDVWLANPSGMCIINGVDLNNDIILNPNGEAVVNLSSTGRFSETSALRASGIDLQVSINPVVNCNNAIILSSATRIATLKAVNGNMSINVNNIPDNLTLEQREDFLYQELNTLALTNELSQTIPKRSGGDQDNFDNFSFSVALAVQEINGEIIAETLIPGDQRAFLLLTEQDRKWYLHKLHKILLKALETGEDSAASDFLERYKRLLNYLKLKSDPEFKNIVSLIDSEELFDDLVELEQDHGPILLDNFEKLSHDDQLGKANTRALIKAIKRGFWGLFISGDWGTQALDSVEETIQAWVTAGIIDGTLSPDYGVYVGSIWGIVRIIGDGANLITHPYMAYQLGKDLMSTIFAASEGSQEAVDQLKDMVPFLGTARLGGDALDLFEEGASDPSKYFEAGKRVTEASFSTFDEAAGILTTGGRLNKLTKKKKKKRKNLEDSGTSPPPIDVPAKPKKVKKLKNIGKTERVFRKGADIFDSLPNSVKKLDDLVAESLELALEAIHNGKHTGKKWGEKYFGKNRLLEDRWIQEMWYGNLVHEIAEDLLRKKIKSDPNLAPLLTDGKIKIERGLDVDGKTLKTDVRYEYGTNEIYVADYSTVKQEGKISKYEKNPDVKVTVAHGYDVDTQKKLDVRPDLDNQKIEFEDFDE